MAPVNTAKTKMVKTGHKVVVVVAVVAVVVVVVLLVVPAVRVLVFAVWLERDSATQIGELVDVLDMWYNIFCCARSELLAL